MMQSNLTLAQRRIAGEIWELLLGHTEGFTLRSTGEPIDFKTGYVVSINGASITISLLAMSVHTNSSLLPLYELIGPLAIAYSVAAERLTRNRGQEHYIGGWRDGTVLYLDISVVIQDLDEALDFAAHNDQKAIYDLAKGASIYR